LHEHILQSTDRTVYLPYEINRRLFSTPFPHIILQCCSQRRRDGVDSDGVPVHISILRLVPDLRHLVQLQISSDQHHTTRI
jgi:hypothetical protein